MTHTPLPWRTGETPFEDQILSVRDIPEHSEDWGDALICETAGNMENAEFIVRACNSHSDLLEALELFAIMGGENPKDGAYQITAQDILRARAAIKQAKGEA